MAQKEKGLLLKIRLLDEKKRRKGRENRLPFTRREKRVLKQETVHVTNLAFLSNSHYDIVADSSLSLRPSWTILESQLLLSLTCTSITILISQRALSDGFYFLNFSSTKALVLNKPKRAYVWPDWPAATRRLTRSPLYWNEARDTKETIAIRSPF